MARNGSGTYSLPQPAFVTGTVISSSAMNSDLSDIASALTQSISADGQTSITGSIKFSGGTAAAPAITFGGDSTTGLYLSSAGVLGFAVSGASAGTWSTSGLANATLASPTLSGTVAGSVTFSGAITFSSTITLSGTAGITLPNGTTGQRPGSPSSGEIRFNTTLSEMEFWNGSAWVQIGTNQTYQSFTTGSGTYTPSTGTLYIKVRMIGGGGGGAGSSGNGGNGGTSSIFSITAVGGGGGIATAGGGSGGVGGTGGTGGTGSANIRIAGGNGQYGCGLSLGAGSQIQPSPAVGAAGPFGLGGYGSGGYGGTASSQATGQPGGGGCGEYVEFIVAAPTAHAYSVGGAGTAGTGAGPTAGITGAIIIEEFYS